MTCQHCHEEILPNERRSPNLCMTTHLECGLAMVLGSWQHASGMCSCTGCIEFRLPACLMSIRDDARRAYALNIHNPCRLN